MVERKMMKEIQRNMVRNFLDTLVMVKLKKGPPMSGYDIMDYIQQKYGVLMSSGTVYSLLYSLERQGLLSASLDSGKRLYTLSDEGVKSVDGVLESKEEIKKFVGNLLQA